MAQHITSGTTVGNAVSTVTFTNWYRSIEVVNRGSADMWARYAAGTHTFDYQAFAFIEATESTLRAAYVMDLTTG